MFRTRRLRRGSEMRKRDVVRTVRAFRRVVSGLKEEVKMIDEVMRRVERMVK